MSWRRKDRRPPPVETSTVLARLESLIERQDAVYNRLLFVLGQISPVTDERKTQGGATSSGGS